MYEDFLSNDKFQSETNANNKLLQYISDKLSEQSKSNTDYGLPEPEAQTTELQIMKLRYDPKQQRELYINLMNMTKPTEDEQQPFLQHVFNAIDNDQSLKIILQGEGGSGKSTMAKIIAAYARSKKLIVMGCASTALAASIYENFYTAHSLFKIPLLKNEEEMLNQENDLECTLDKNPGRKLLLQATKVFIWDEISSQHVRDFSAAYKAMNNFDNKIIILMGDKMQIAPVVKNGTIHQIHSASIYCSKYMDIFEKHFFSRNLRLIAATDDSQTNYAKMLLEIGKGTYFEHDTNQNFITVIPADELTANDTTLQKPVGTTTIAFNNIEYEMNIQNIISWLHPNNFDLTTITKNCILAVTNVQVDAWNAEIQKLNPEPIQELTSEDSFDDVDDPNDYIKNMITEDVMISYTENGSPPHKLYLKANDICILLRPVDNQKGLTNNTRVRILNISRYRIHITNMCHSLQIQI
jgi:energy-coupling factor transporter ATP-binding protein EcfA2